MATTVKIIMRRRELFLMLGTIAAICAAAGAMYGAYSAQGQEMVADCEARTAARCRIIAAPLIETKPH